MQTLAIKLQHKHIDKTNSMESNYNCFKNVTEAVTDSMKLRDDYKKNLFRSYKDLLFHRRIFQFKRNLSLCDSDYPVNFHDEQLQLRWSLSQDQPLLWDMTWSGNARRGKDTLKPLPALRAIGVLTPQVHRWLPKQCTVCLTQTTCLETGQGQL